MDELLTDLKLSDKHKAFSREAKAGGRLRRGGEEATERLSNLQELSAAVPICRVVLGLLHPLRPAFFRLWVRAQRRDPNAFRRLPKQDSVCPDLHSLGSFHPPRSMSLWILEGESEGLFGMARKARLPEKPHGPGLEVEDLFLSAAGCVGFSWAAANNEKSSGERVVYRWSSSTLQPWTSVYHQAVALTMQGAGFKAASPQEFMNWQGESVLEPRCETCGCSVPQPLLGALQLRLRTRQALAITVMRFVISCGTVSCTSTW
ncbi:hypothetical protein Anapl_01779 [Anas platyrhynchos]|uniref:Uncharacterized protein n=1 Tax=Anas platyrhynchos TaxID=8839 RepID=R0LTE4_ANAPL|nr:hypothetical protein Anapl_01779 [Anas platyrhynchos]